jgi:pectate lyase
MDGQMSASRRPAWVAAVLTAAVATATFLVAASTAHAATIFSEDFEAGASGWSKSGGSWSVVTDGSQVYRQSSTGSDAKAQVGSTAWTDYAVTARVKPLAWSGSDRSVGVVARAQNMTNYYQLGLSNSGQIQLVKRVSGGLQVLGTAVAAITTGSWYTLKLEAFGSTLRGYLDGTLVVSAVDSSFSAGRIGLFTRYASGAFDDLQVSDQPDPGSTTSPPPSSPPPAGDCEVGGSANGFASVNAWGQNGTTGGAGGPTVEVDTAAELISAIGGAGPLTVCVVGMVTLPAGIYDVASDKSIVGLGASSGITGGGLNIGLPVDDGITSPPANAVHNVIIQNLVFRNASDDSINVQMFSHHVWIDHNDLASGFDGLVDVKRGSSYVTVSWNHTHDHTKNMLLGHSDGNAAQDVGQLKVTYHHNWFDRTPQRNPRVRFGEPVHVYNNYYVRNSDTGVACQANAGCLVEGNYFEDVEEPVTNHYSGPTGRCVARNNVFVGEEAGQPDCSGSVQEPSSYYPYTVDNPNDVRSIVMAGAGTGNV